MTHKLDISDFRAHRRVLDPSDFALGSDEPDSPPTDLISEESWHGIMTLPDDVAIRTTSYQGSRIEVLHELWSGWISAFPEQGIISSAMLDSTDDFNAAIFNLIHGYYRQSLMSLRAALETMVFACECKATGNLAKWNGWLVGNEEVRFSSTCKKLRNLSNYIVLEEKSLQLFGACIFPTDNKSQRSWAVNLYKRLSEFSHARGNSTNSALWQSNGPVYSADGMKVAYQTHVETYALLTLLIKLTDNKFLLPTEAHVIYQQDSFSLYLKKPFQELCAFYSKTLFIS